MEKTKKGNSFGLRRVLCSNSGKGAMWSWRSNIVKHLSYTAISSLSSQCFQKLSRHTCPQPSSSFPTLFRNHKARDYLPKTKPNVFYYFSSETSQTDSSFVSPYLLVNVRCHKDAADMLSEALLCFGATSTTIDQKHPLPTSHSDEVRVNSTPLLNHISLHWHLAATKLSACVCIYLWSFSCAVVCI